MKRVNCIGVAVMDALSGPLESYPVPRLRTQVTTDSIRFMPGGGCVNTASALARMGVAVSAFSKVGDDPSGVFVRQELSKCGVDVSGIAVSAADSTPFTFVGIHSDGDRTFIHTPGANRTLTLADLDIERLLDADFLLYQDLFVLPGLDGPPAIEILSEARKRGVATLLDECWGYGPDRALLESMAAHCDYVLPSVDDLQPLYPGDSAEEIARALLALGPKAVALKMGSEGCLLAEGDEIRRIQSYPSNVIDTTGAGDCWDAGFIAGLMHGENAETSARIGCACAAFCIESIGGATGIPPFEAVRKRAADVRGG